MSELPWLKRQKTTVPGEKFGLVKLTTVYRLFNPQVPVIICSKFRKEIAAMPANSCSSVSNSPPLVSLALKKGIRTNTIVRSSQVFSLNWINFEPESSRRIVLDLAKPSLEKRSYRDKLNEYNIPYRILKGAPVLNNARAFALCRINKQLAVGDHDLFIARVTYARAIRDFTEDEYWRFQDYKPVLYVGSIRRNPLITMVR